MKFRVILVAAKTRHSNGYKYACDHQKQDQSGLVDSVLDLRLRKVWVIDERVRYVSVTHEQTSQHYAIIYHHKHQHCLFQTLHVLSALLYTGNHPFQPMGQTHQRCYKLEDVHSQGVFVTRFHGYVDGETSQVAGYGEVVVQELQEHEDQIYQRNYCLQGRDNNDAVASCLYFFFQECVILVAHFILQFQF